MSVRAGFLATTAVFCLSIWSAPHALAADPQLKLPSFDRLQRLAVDSVNVTIGQWPLNMAALALENSADPRDRELQAVVKGIKAITVHSFKFAADQSNSSEVDAVRSQLSTPGWNSLAKIRQHGGDEDVDIYVSMDHETVNGLVVITSSARELTIVNVVGSIDPAKLAGIGNRLGLPGFSM